MFYFPSFIVIPFFLCSLSLGALFSLSSLLLLHSLLIASYFLLPTLALYPLHSQPTSPHSPASIPSPTEAHFSSRVLVHLSSRSIASAYINLGSRHLPSRAIHPPFAIPPFSALAHLSPTSLTIHPPWPTSRQLSSSTRRSPPLTYVSSSTLTYFPPTLTHLSPPTLTYHPPSLAHFSPPSPFRLLFAHCGILNYSPLRQLRAWISQLRPRPQRYGLFNLSQWMAVRSGRRECC